MVREGGGGGGDSWAWEGRVRRRRGRIRGRGLERRILVFFGFVFIWGVVEVNECGGKERVEGGGKRVAGEMAMEVR
jgi:hypothetical protein